MPHFAYLEEPLICPSCKITIANMVMFQWGYSPGFGQRDEYLYHINDRIRWKVCKDGSIPAWAYFVEQDHEAGGNLGDPSVLNLIVKDSFQFVWEEPLERKKCPQCQEPVEGAVIEIRDGILKRAWIYEAGDFINDVDIYLITSDEALMPMPDWNDHPMITLKDC